MVLFLWKGSRLENNSLARVSLYSNLFICEAQWNNRELPEAESRTMSNYTLCSFSPLTTLVFNHFYHQINVLALSAQQISELLWTSDLYITYILLPSEWNCLLWLSCPSLAIAFWVCVCQVTYISVHRFWTKRTLLGASTRSPACGKGHEVKGPNRQRWVRP